VRDASRSVSWQSGRSESWRHEPGNWALTLQPIICSLPIVPATPGQAIRSGALATIQLMRRVRGRRSGGSCESRSGSSIAAFTTCGTMPNTGICRIEFFRNWDQHPKPGLTHFRYSAPMRHSPVWFTEFSGSQATHHPADRIVACFLWGWSSPAPSLLKRGRHRGRSELSRPTRDRAKVQ